MNYIYNHQTHKDVYLWYQVLLRFHIFIVDGVSLFFLFLLLSVKTSNSLADIFCNYITIFSHLIAYPEYKSGTFSIRFKYIYSRFKLQSFPPGNKF